MNNQRQFDLSDKVALITGASHGIGEAIAVAYAQAGAKIVLPGVNRQVWMLSHNAIMKQAASIASGLRCLIKRDILKGKLDLYEPFSTNDF